MSKIAKARVFVSGRSQQVTIPAEYRFSGDEVYIRRDPQTADLILSPSTGNWEAIYDALDRAGFPEDFLTDRHQGTQDERENL